MAGIKDYSSIAGNNTAAPPNGAPENMAPSSVNDTQRQVMADIRSYYETPQWRDWGHTVTRASNTTFTIAADVAAIYIAGQKIKCVDSSDLYGTIISSSFSSPNTTVTVELETGNLSASLSAVQLGAEIETSVQNWLGMQRYAINAVTTTYTVTVGDFNKLITADTSGGAFTITLPAAATAGAGFLISLIKIDSSSNALTIDGNSAETINGATTRNVTKQWDSLVLRCDGSNWVVESGQAVAPSQENIIIGGDFSLNPWQRGTSFAAAADGTYTADRWEYHKSGAMVHTISKSADAPTVSEAGIYSTHCLLADCTTADASIAAGDYSYIHQYIEGYNFTRIAQRGFTLSFWAKHTKTGTYCVAFRNSGADRSYVAEYTINTTDTWEYKTVTVTASPSAGTWDYTNGIGLEVIFTIDAGSTFQTTADAWQTGSYLATSNQVNGSDSTSNNFRIQLVQINEGQAAAPFQLRSFQEGLYLCERYFQKSYNQGVDPGTVTDAGRIFERSTSGGISNRMNAIFKTKMRDTPTITWYSPSAGTANRWDDNFTLRTVTGQTYTGASSTGYPLGGNYSAADNVGSAHYIADSEL